MSAVLEIYLAAAITLPPGDREAAYQDISAITGVALIKVRDLAWRDRMAQRRAYERARRLSAPERRRAGLRVVPCTQPAEVRA